MDGVVYIGRRGTGIVEKVATENPLETNEDFINFLQRLSTINITLAWDVIIKAFEEEKPPLLKELLDRSNIRTIPETDSLRFAFPQEHDSEKLDLYIFDKESKAISSLTQGLTPLGEEYFSSAKLDDYDSEMLLMDIKNKLAKSFFDKRNELRIVAKKVADRMDSGVGEYDESLRKENGYLILRLNSNDYAINIKNGNLQKHDPLKEGDGWGDIGYEGIDIVLESLRAPIPPEVTPVAVENHYSLNEMRNFAENIHDYIKEGLTHCGKFDNLAKQEDWLLFSFEEKSYAIHIDGSCIAKALLADGIMIEGSYEHDDTSKILEALQFTQDDSISPLGSALPPKTDFVGISGALNVNSTATKPVPRRI